MRTSLVGAVIVFTVLLSFALGVIGYRQFYKSMILQYQNYAETTLRLAVSDFDWDAVDRCIQTMEEGDAIKALRTRLDYIKTASDIGWLYMVEPLNADVKDNMRYLCTGITAADYETYGVTPLGKLTGTEFPSEVAQHYLDFFRTSAPGAFWYYPNKTKWGYMYTTSLVVRTSSGKPLGVMSVDIHMKEIERVMRVFPIVIFAVGFILALIFIAALSLWLDRRIVLPLSRLQKSAEQFVKSSHGSAEPETLVFANPKISTRDEFESLSDALLTMASDLKNYMKNLMHETAEKERIGAELSVATHIQSSMLPIIFPPFPDRKEIDIYASMTPAKEVGGDFYDFFMLDERHIAIVVADVSGKGVPAALFMVIGKTLIKDHTQPNTDPADVFMKVNDLLCESNGEGLFITAFLGVLDLVTGEFRYVNAGHEPPYIYHEGSFSEHKIPPAFVLAGMKGMKYKSGSITLMPGDKVFQYTDGVTEATNADEKLYGDERLSSVLNNADAVSVREVCEAVKADVDRFVGNAPQFDDITMLCLEYKERMKI